MFHKIKNVEVLPGFNLTVTFQNGERKSYQAAALFDIGEAFRAFETTPRLFEQARVAQGGYGVVWNDDLDVSSEELYLNGAVCPSAVDKTPPILDELRAAPR